MDGGANRDDISPNQLAKKKRKIYLGRDWGQKNRNGAHQQKKKKTPNNPPRDPLTSSGG